MPAGGWKAILSVMGYAKEIGVVNLIKAVNSKNACKACAFGTGGQNGGVYNERGYGIEICNKNIQAHTSDARPAISANFFFENAISDLSAYTGYELEHLGRIGVPLYKGKGDSHYKPIRYEDALERLAQKLRVTSPEKSFFYASGRSSNEAAFLLQLFARLYGTNNINNCSYYCHQASGAALLETVGTGTSTVEYADLDHADTVFVFGANPASNHPRFLKTLISLRRRGGHIIVVNPAKETGLLSFASPSDFRSMLKGGEDIASVYIQPHLGGDIAFMQGVIKYLNENNHLDDAFLENYSEGSARFFRSVSAVSWDEIIQNSGVSKSLICDVGNIYARSRRAIFCWSMGLTHHLHGVANIQTLVALATSRGMIGKPGAGLLPLRGHSNIQGTGTMGFTPQLKQAVEVAIQNNLNIELPKHKGLDTMACMDAANNGNMDLAVFLGGNIYSANPDSKFSEKALGSIDFKCFFNSTLNQSHFHGVDGEVLILPVKVRDEETQRTTQESMFNFVRLSDGGVSRLEQLKSETDLICTVGEKVISKDIFDFSIFRDHTRIRKLIAKTVPGMKNLANIDDSKKEFHIDNRILHKPNFSTDSGKIKLKFHVSPKRKNNTMLLSTVRSEGQFNSIIYHEKDSYRNQTSRDVIMMNEVDIKANKLTEGERITIQSATGELNNLKVTAFDIRPGNAMTYYPEANVLVPKTVDDVSRTPAFKSIPIEIKKQIN